MTHQNIQSVFIPGLHKKQWNWVFLAWVYIICVDCFTSSSSKTILYFNLKLIILPYASSNSRSLYPTDSPDMPLNIQEGANWVDIIWLRNIKILDQSGLYYLHRRVDADQNNTIYPTMQKIYRKWCFWCIYTNPVFKYTINLNLIEQILSTR